MDKIYEIMSKVLAFLPKEWNNKDVQGAVLGFIIVALSGGAAWQYGPGLWQWLSRLWG